MKGYPPLDVVQVGVASIQPFDCGTCPVTLACAIDKGGNGFTFSCCGSTGFDTIDENGEPLLLVIDCTQHHFEKMVGRPTYEDLSSCPLCSGQIMDNILLKLIDRCLWVPTVYAKFPVQTRLDVWRRGYTAACDRARWIEREKKGT